MLDARKTKDIVYFRASTQTNPLYALQVIDHPGTTILGDHKRCKCFLAHIHSMIEPVDRYVARLKHERGTELCADSITKPI